MRFGELTGGVAEQPPMIVHEQCCRPISANRHVDGVCLAQFIPRAHRRIKRVHTSIAKTVLRASMSVVEHDLHMIYMLECRL